MNENNNFDCLAIFNTFLGLYNMELNNKGIKKQDEILNKLNKILEVIDNGNEN